MRVALDMAATRLARTGIARVTLSLADALVGRGDVCLLRVGEGSSPPHGSWRRRALAARLDLLWHPVQGMRAAVAGGAQLYHCPAPRAPLTRGQLPLVVSVHDLTVLMHPHTMSRWNRLYTRATLRRVLASADRVVAVSNDTANDLDRLLGVGGERVRVVHNGVDGAFFDAPPGPAPVGGEYLLFVGTPEPRKNLQRLLGALTLLRERGFAGRLVVAGSDGWGGVTLPGNGGGSGASAGVVALGRVDDITLRALYAHARCLVLPSLHEGFGLPALEAMAAGCPVVAAGVGALPEVCGDAAVLVDPLSPHAIAAGIERALHDGDPLRAAGRERARAFGWDRAAESLVGVYRELI